MDKTGALFAFILLPSNNPGIYAAVKRVADLKLGIHTVCAEGGFFANLALKINMKLGGTNNGLESIISGVGEMLKSEDTMLVGCDVTHPSPGCMEGAPSVASVIASMDKHFGQYITRMGMQHGKKEMIENLQKYMKSLLDLYYNRNKKYPKQIIVYRDGVSEGQYPIVLEEELPQIKAAIKECGIHIGIQACKLAIVIVGKRHHTCMYPTHTYQLDGYLDLKTREKKTTGNFKPGLIVDKRITSTYGFDFYVQAHKGIQGTARPTHYIVIYNQLSLTVDNIQGFTHALCYQFGRSTRSVSIIFV
ncbi:stem cell self-renewal protein Piwi [Ascodesmis nigricans]|uniref:Stem cell self-renewal protein Piwi n=1 Tax=Ascodesmis nigricans TaxID=341454 RepID=A0A4S2MY81_9PEZI|nr:stem cell self-renewal protein Piwi [Ascodesmis nigricans]